MNMAFFKKEIKYFFSPARIFSLPAVFVFFAILSAPLTKYLPEIISYLAQDTLGSFQLPEITVVDAFIQYYGNVSQTIMIIALIMFSILISTERQNNTAELMLTRPLTRRNFILSIFISVQFYFSIWFTVAALVHVVYSYMFFNTLPVNIFMSFALLWLNCTVHVSVFVFISTFFKKNIPAIVVSFISWFVLSIFSGLPKIGAFFPSAVFQISCGVLNEGYALSVSTALKCILPSALLTLGLPVLSVVVFNKEELS